MTDAAAMPEARGKRRKQGATRAMLVEACVDLIREEGVSALTTQRVAHRAGISQPGFYNHFDNIDGLLREAVDRVYGDMARRQTEARRKVLEAYQHPEETIRPENVRRGLESTLGVVLDEPRFAELFLRYAGDPTLLGGAAKAIADRARDETIEDIWALSMRMGSRPEDYARVAVYTEQMLALYYNAAVQILGHRYSRALVIDATTEALVALGTALNEALARDASR